MRALGLAVLSLSLPLAACGGTPVLRQMAPGTELPNDWLGMCAGYDTANRCNKMAYGNGLCINPQGLDAEPAVMRCQEIVDRHLTPYHPAAKREQECPALGAPGCKIP